MICPWKVDKKQVGDAKFIQETTISFGGCDGNQCPFYIGAKLDTKRCGRAEAEMKRGEL